MYYAQTIATIQIQDQQLSGHSNTIFSKHVFRRAVVQGYVIYLFLKIRFTIALQYVCKGTH